MQVYSFQATLLTLCCNSSVTRMRDANSCATRYSQDARAARPRIKTTAHNTRHTSSDEKHEHLRCFDLLVGRGWPDPRQCHRNRPRWIWPGWFRLGWLRLGRLGSSHLQRPDFGASSHLHRQPRQSGTHPGHQNYLRSHHLGPCDQRRLGWSRLGRPRPWRTRWTRLGRPRRQGSLGRPRQHLGKLRSWQGLALNEDEVLTFFLLTFPRRRTLINHSLL